MTDATFVIRLNRLNHMLRDGRGMPPETLLDLCSAHVERLMAEVAGGREGGAGPASAFVGELAERLGRRGN